MPVMGAEACVETPTRMRIISDPRIHQADANDDLLHELQKTMPWVGLVSLCGMGFFAEEIAEGATLTTCPSCRNVSIKRAAGALREVAS